MEHLRADRGHRRRLRRAADRRGAGADRAAAGRLGARRRRRAPASRSRWARPASWSSAGSGWPATSTPGKDAEKFAPAAVARLGRAPTAAATSSAPSRAGCCSSAAADEQVKLGGRRIELGEVDAALQALPGVAGAAAAVRRTAAGNQLLVGYVVPRDGTSWTPTPRRCALREQLPAALVPLLAVVDDLPTRTSGKVDRDALPWPLPAGRARPVAAGLLTADRGVAGRAVGGDPRRAGRPTRTPTSSPTAAAASPRRSWWRGSAPGTRRCPSPTSTSTRRWARSRPGWTR